MCGAVGVRSPHLEERALEIALPYVERFDAFRDNPWPILYRDLDRLVPGSRFILTTRDLDSWVRSAVGHFGNDDTPMRAWIYGAAHPLGNEDVYRDRHARHVAEVREHFRGRPGDFLELALVEGEGWEKLCAFLGAPLPGVPFPNRAPRRKKRPLHRRAAAWAWRTLQGRPR